MRRDAEQQQSEEGRAHADRERERLRLLVGEMADQRLQQRRGELERQRDHADLPEVERVGVLQDRIDEAISDCMVSLRKCEKLMPASTI